MKRERALQVVLVLVGLFGGAGRNRAHVPY
jgi:hypothetical protein